MKRGQPVPSTESHHVLPCRPIRSQIRVTWYIGGPIEDPWQCARTEQMESNAAKDVGKVTAPTIWQDVKLQHAWVIVWVCSVYHTLYPPNNHHTFTRSLCPSKTTVAAKPQVSTNLRGHPLRFTDLQRSLIGASKGARANRTSTGC